MLVEQEHRRDETQVHQHLDKQQQLNLVEGKSLQSLVVVFQRQKDLLDFIQSLLNVKLYRKIYFKLTFKSN